MTSPVKERLTGALILIVAVVIIVPELFSGRAEQRPSTDAPEAQSAADGPPLRSYTMELGGGQAQPEPQAAAGLPVEPAPEPVPETVPEASPAQASPEANDLPEVAVAQPEVETPKPAEKPATTTPTTRGWWVQLGSFSSRANADRLGGTLSAAGYPMVVSPTMSKGKELYRVRAGPVADREAAVALQSRLNAAGHKGSLVAPQ